MTDKDITEAEALMKAAQMAEAAAEYWTKYAESLRHGEAPATFAPDERDETLDEKLVRLPLGDACVEYLKTCKKPKSAKEIWAALEKAGRESESPNPEKSVGWMIKKLIGQGHDDLFSPGFGQWDLKSKYSTRRLNKILKSRAGRGGRSREEHINKTKAGIEKARAAGKQIGVSRKYTDEHIRKLKRLMDDEGATAKAACEALGMPYSTYVVYNKAIKVWRDGDPWPLSDDIVKERLREMEGGPNVRLVSSNE